MKNKLLEDITKRKSKFIFIGETGSGKSELAINFALYFTKMTSRQIHFFDMDQTKPLFRAREVKKYLVDNEIVFHSSQQLLDMPTIPHGVEDKINNPNNITIFDIGGNVTGARSMGQFSKYLNGNDAVSYYVINYYRPFSGSLKDIEQTISQILNATGITSIEIISNPNLGASTTIKEVLDGHKKTCEMLKNTNYKISFLAILGELYNDLLKEILEDVIKISSYIKYPWKKD